MIADLISPAVLALMSSAIAVPSIAVVWGLLRVDLRWGVAAGLVAIVVMLALFAYTASAIFAVYAQPDFGDNYSSIELGIAYQRVAAGQLAAVFFVAGLLAVEYYLELARR